MLPIYRPSGKFSPLFIILAVLGIIAALAPAWVYQFLMDLNPFFSFNYLITVGFAFLLARVARFLVQTGKCRNTVVALAAALLMGGVTAGATHYFAYLSFRGQAAEAAQVQGPDAKEAVAKGEPIGFTQYIDQRVETGWTMGKNPQKPIPVTGIFVWLLWGIEALTLMGGAAYGAVKATKDPFCDVCGEWAQQQQEVSFLAPSLQAIDEVASAQSIAALLAVELDSTGDHADALLFKPSSCPSCSASHFLDIQHRQITFDRDGNDVIKDVDLLTRVALTPEQAGRLRHKFLRAQGVKREDFDAPHSAATAEELTPRPAKSHALAPGLEPDLAEPDLVEPALDREEERNTW